MKNKVKGCPVYVTRWRCTKCGVEGETEHHNFCAETVASAIYTYHKRMSPACATRQGMDSTRYIIELDTREVSDG